MVVYDLRRVIINSELRTDGFAGSSTENVDLADSRKAQQGIMERILRADPFLLREVRRFGRFDVNGCYNCGSCTLSCDLAAFPASFPRRSVQSVVLGLPDLVRGSIEPWLCQDCGDCSTKCPQDAEPRASMATLRRYLTAQYDVTGLSAKVQTSRAWAIGSLAVAGLLVVALMAAYHVFRVGLSVSDLATQSMGLAHMFPTITWFTLAAVLCPLFLLAANAVRMHRLIMGRDGGGNVPFSVYSSEAAVFFRQLLLQERMGECPESSRKRRRTRHVLLAAGCFIILVFLVFFLRVFQTDAIHPVWHPQRWLGYIATAFIVFGAGDMIAGRLEKRNEIYGRSDPEDYFLPVLLLLTAISGIAVHALRYAGLSFAAHYTYLVHLVISVPLLVVELPFGRWSHMVYRPLAIYLQAVRSRADAADGIPGREAA